MNPYKNTPQELPRAAERFELLLYFRGYSALENNMLDFRESVIRETIPNYTTT
jgi:hypothetical protein